MLKDYEGTDKNTVMSCRLNLATRLSKVDGAFSSFPDDREWSAKVPSLVEVAAERVPKVAQVIPHGLQLALHSHRRRDGTALPLLVGRRAK